MSLTRFVAQTNARKAKVDAYFYCPLYGKGSLFAFQDNK